MTNGFLDCYLRVSSRTQLDDGNSIESQRRIGKQVSKKLKLKYREHNEKDKSSTNIKVKRHILEEIKDGIELGEIKNIWVWEQSRLFRDEYDSIHFKKYFLDKYNILFYTGESTSGIQFNKNQSNILYLLNSYFSSEESRTIRRRSVRGKRFLLDTESKNKPIHLGGTPQFGYKVVDKLLEIEKDESKWVKWMFNSYIKGTESIEIKKELDRSGIKPRRTKLWNLGTIQKMLRNESYTGLKRFYDKELEKEWVYKIPQIISVSLYQKVQKKLEENKRNQDNNKKTNFLLDGILFCDCGLGMGSESKTRSYGKTETYYCYSIRRSWRGEIVPECNNKKSLDREITDTQVMSLIKDVVGKSVTLKEQFKKDILSQKRETDNDIKEEKRKLEVRIKKLQGEIGHTIDNIGLLEFEKIQGKKDEKVVDKILNLLEKERETLEKEYHKTTQEIEDVDNKKEWLDWLGKYGEDLRLKTSTHIKKQEWIKGLVKEIIVHPEFGTNRDGKEVQVGQTIEVRFNMKIVNDKLKYKNINKKSDGYEVVDGTYRKKSSVLTLSKGRGQPKKKLISKDNSEKKRLFQPIQQ